MSLCRSIHDVAACREPSHFSQLKEPTHRSNLLLLKRIYHSLLTCPSCSLAAYLAIPDLELIASGGVSNSVMEQDEAWRIELLKLCRVVLLVQAVWSTQNEGVIGVITNLGVQDQKALKEVIEDALKSLPTPTSRPKEETLETADSPSHKDEIDNQAEVLYELQSQRRKAEQEAQELKLRVANMDAAPQSPQKVKESRASTPARLLPPSARRTPRHSFSESSTSPGEETRDGAEENPFENASMENTSKRRAGKHLNDAKGVTASPMERMKNLEIQRLKGEVSEKEEEIASLELQVQQGKRQSQHMPKR